MTTKDKNHIHQLRKKKYKTGQAFFYCLGEDCTFRINADLALNKRSLCNICGKPFNMTQYSMRLAKPHCEDCHKSRVETDVVAPKGFFDNLLANSLGDSDDKAVTIKTTSPPDDTEQDSSFGTRVVYNEYNPNDFED